MTEPSDHVNRLLDEAAATLAGLDPDASEELKAPLKDESFATLAADADDLVYDHGPEELLQSLSLEGDEPVRSIPAAIVTGDQARVEDFRALLSLSSLSAVSGDVAHADEDALTETVRRLHDSLQGRFEAGDSVAAEADDGEVETEAETGDEAGETEAETGDEDADALDEIDDEGAESQRDGTGDTEDADGGEQLRAAARSALEATREEFEAIRESIGGYGEGETATAGAETDEKDDGADEGGAGDGETDEGEADDGEGDDDTDELLDDVVGSLGDSDASGGGSSGLTGESDVGSSGGPTRLSTVPSRRPDMNAVRRHSTMPERD